MNEHTLPFVRPLALLIFVKHRSTMQCTAVQCNPVQSSKVHSQPSSLKSWHHHCTFVQLHTTSPVTVPRKSLPATTPRHLPTIPRIFQSPYSRALLVPQNFQASTATAPQISLSSNANCSTVLCLQQTVYVLYAFGIYLNYARIRTEMCAGCPSIRPSYRFDMLYTVAAESVFHL